MVQNIQLFKDLHHIQNVIIVDHMLCGAVHSHLLKTHRCKDQEDIENTELSIHTEYLRYAARVIGQEIPGLKVKLFLYKEDGVVQEVDTEPAGIILLDKF